MENKYKAIIIGIVVILIGVFFYQTRPLTKSECYRLGSNERMLACLAEVESRNPTPTTQPEYLTDTELLLLSLNNQHMDGNSYYNQNPTFTGTLQNNTGRTAYDVMVQFKFFPYTTGGNCNDASADTEYLNVTPMIISGDSKALKVNVQTPFDTSGRFSWCAKVVAAKLNQ